MTAVQQGDDGLTLEGILAGIPPGRSLRLETVHIWHPPGRVGLLLQHVDPGAPRRVPTKLCPLLVGDEGQTVADLLTMVAGAWARAEEMKTEGAAE